MKAITTHSNELGELTFPLIYICEGIFTLYPIPKFFPLFIQILQELNNVSKVLGIYIPSVKTAIFTLLGSKEFFKKKSNKKPKAFDFDIHIKAQKEYILTNAFWNSTFNEILDLIIEFLAIHSKTIFFPELTNFVVYQLKKHQKKYTFNFYKMKIKLILQKIQENKEKVWEKRKTFKKSVVKKTECLEFKAMKEKSSLEKEFERIHEEKENMRKQKILAEKEDGTNEEDSNLSEEENDIDELSQGKYDEDNEKPLSEEEDLDLE